MKPLLWATILLFICCYAPVFSQSLYDNSITPADAKTEAYLPLLKNKRVALIINHTSVVNGVSLLDILLANKVNVVKIFVPEHGFRGNEDAGAKVDNAIDSATHLPVISLYGKHKKPNREDVADIDVLVYDLQDVGVRFYTYISTLEYCMEACAENKKKIIVLDRPNPNGFYVDGPVLEMEHKSFVGMQPIPIVYGMTAGEYANMLAGERWFGSAADINLEVVKCLNYSHEKKYQLPIAPSPNLKTMTAVYAYPSLCLFEGTVVSVGRGTDIPFQQFGNPELKGRYMYSFIPESRPGAKSPPFELKVCFGEVAGTGVTEVLEKLDGGLRLNWLIETYTAYPDKSKFFSPFFTKLSGTTKLEEMVKSGITEAVIRNSWKTDLTAFKRIRKKYLLYDDFKN